MTQPESSNPSRGSLDRFGEIVARIYPDLRRIAAARAASVGGSASSLAQATVVKLISLPNPPRTEESALALGCRMMEWTKIDRIRADVARRTRENGTRQAEARERSSDGQVERLAMALDELGELSPRKAEILMLSAIARMPQQRVAEVFGISERTVQRELEFARAWVAARMREPAGSGREPVK